MAERPIRIFGDPVLKTVSDAIADPASARALVQDLLDSVALPGRAGVAACQIGVNLRAFSWNVDGEIGYVINPTLVEVAGEIELLDEGCLSVPELFFTTPRYPFARVVGVDLDGETVDVSGTGLLAQALQHECDHLDGMLYLDRLEQPIRREALRAIRGTSWF